MPTRIAAGIALGLLAVFGGLGFGWRSWMQYRRTGSTGIRMMRGSAMDRAAALGLALALVVAGAAPILQLTNVVQPLDGLRATWIQVLGVLVATAGIAAMVYAQLVMGDSWRMGVDVRETTTLVRTGVFGWVRNPIYTAMVTFDLGVALVTPNPIALTGLILLVLTIELQVRRVEEPHLLRIHGDAYRAYAASVGRFVPRVGMIR
jgi:protein-S-isoprenylcysteine O-methyltransferase Ste14